MLAFSRRFRICFLLASYFHICHVCMYKRERVCVQYCAVQRIETQSMHMACVFMKWLCWKGSVTGFIWDLPWHYMATGTDRHTHIHTHAYTYTHMRANTHRHTFMHACSQYIFQPVQRILPYPRTGFKLGLWQCTQTHIFMHVIEKLEHVHIFLILLGHNWTTWYTFHSDPFEFHTRRCLGTVLYCKHCTQIA